MNHLIMMGNVNYARTKMNKREPAGTIASTVKAMDYREVLEVINQLNLTTKPREHQARAVYIGIDQNTFLYALDMGTGKTKIALDLISTNKLLNGRVRALVTCPPVVLRQWRKETQKHSKLNIQIVDSHSSKEKLKQLSTETDIVTVSHPYLVSVFRQAENKTNIRNTLESIFEKFDILIIDEAHIMKNPDTKGFKGYCKYLLQIQKRYLMTGTPIGNSYTGVWSLYYILDKGETFGKSFNTFLLRYFNTYNTGMFNTYKLRKDRKSEFMRLFWKRAIRWEEYECSDLPGKTSIVIPAKMTQQQQREYDAALSAASNKGYETTQDPEFELMRITAGIDSKVSPKLETLKELVKQICIENKQQFIVWCWLREENEFITTELSKKFKQLNIEQIKGGLGKTKTNRILDDWSDGKVDILIANQKSLGIGVDLYEASNCCFFSNNRSVIDRKQAEKRIHRTGQTKHCIYIDLVCEQTIDELNLSIVKRAADAFTELTKDANIMQLAHKQRNSI